jgi:cell division septation protein DedD
VEAPEVFQITEAALWDGRPSLGGVWVAHPDVTDPQRVIIRNMANDTSVIGALFRRERDIPGPRIQASSDAAEALSMLAGAPVQLNVTALIREAPDPEPEEAAADITPEPTETAPEPTETSAAVTAPIPTVIDADTVPPSDAESQTPEPERKTGFRWPWSKPAADATAPLVTGGTAAAAAVAASELPPASTPAAVTSDLEKPFVQIGIFSLEDNADRAATRVRSAGMVPNVYEQQSNGQTFWRVLVGPSFSESEQASHLKKLKDTGFPDAYTVTN